jgi:hypothetical protein
MRWMLMMIITYIKLIDYTCMISIGCKPMMLITLIWLKLG